MLQLENILLNFVRFHLFFDSFIYKFNSSINKESYNFNTILNNKYRIGNNSYTKTNYKSKYNPSSVEKNGVVNKYSNVNNIKINNYKNYSKLSSNYSSKISSDNYNKVNTISNNKSNIINTNKSFSSKLNFYNKFDSNKKIKNEVNLSNLSNNNTTYLLNSDKKSCINRLISTKKNVSVNKDYIKNNNFFNARPF